MLPRIRGRRARTEVGAVPRELPGSDASVQATASDAVAGKLSAASLGYIDDRFLNVLAGGTVGEPARRLPPVINRGNFARASCIEKLVLDFLGDRQASSSIKEEGGETEQSKESQGPITAAPAAKPQVISLGAGKDSLFFRLADKGITAAGGYFEVDFETVSNWKARLIARTPILSVLAGGEGEHDGKPPQGGELGPKDGTTSPRGLYSLVSADLRDIPAVERGLLEAGADFSAPTIFLAECVLVYMEPAESAALLQWCASMFPESLFAAYEMTSPGDVFGKMMKQNIQRMGCLLPGLEPYPTLSSQEERFTKAGWDSARAIDMLSVFQDFLDRDEVRRVSKIEVLDEVEEWELIMRHYCLVVAAKGEDSVARLGAMSPPR